MLHKLSNCAGGGTESFNTVIRNATDIGSTIYDTNRIGGSFQYGFTPAQGWEPLFTSALSQVTSWVAEMTHTLKPVKQRQTSSLPYLGPCLWFRHGLRCCTC